MVPDHGRDEPPNGSTGVSVIYRHRDLGTMVPADRISTRILGRLDALRRRVDDVRIREHLRRTELDLRRSSPADLTAAQRRRRADALDRLRAYRQAGEFPVNRREPTRVPCFVGADGTPCAVAHLVRADGREDLVAEVMADDPTVRLEDVEDGPLVEWIESSGLTMEEAARIQPSYPYAVQFATDCGPVACSIAWALASLFGLTVAATSEYVGYRLASDLFPDNALKRRASLGYVTVLNLFLAPFVVLLAFSLFP